MADPGRATSKAQAHHWQVTVRAAEAGVEPVRSILLTRLLPLLAVEADCRNPRVAACVNCAGEFTYLAEWPARAAIERFEQSAAYSTIAAALRPHLSTSVKRELWKILEPIEP